MNSMTLKSYFSSFLFSFFFPCFFNGFDLTNTAKLVSCFLFHLEFCFGFYINNILNFTFVVLLQRFGAVIMRIREPKTTALIFASGKDGKF